MKERKIDMVILGLLSHEDLTGYDIKKRIDGAIRFFWKGSYGSIYPALRDMEDKNLIIKQDASYGMREKILYQITARGKEVLNEWLKEEQASNELKYETLLKLFFGGSADREISVHNIELFEEQIKAELRLLKAYCRNLENELDKEGHIYYYLTALFGVESYEAYLKWCAKTKKLLKREG